MSNTLYHHDTSSLECKHCKDVIELSQTTSSNPALLFELREEYEIMHSKCNHFNNMQAASNQQGIVSVAQRRLLHQAMASAFRFPASTH